MNYKTQIMEFLSRYIDLNNVDDDTNFIEKGLVNSMFYMQLIVSLETTFDITVHTEEIDPSNFCSINNIVTFVKNKCE